MPVCFPVRSPVQFCFRVRFLIRFPVHVQIKRRRHPGKQQQDRRKDHILPHKDRHQAVDRQKGIKCRGQHKPQYTTPPPVQPVQEKPIYHSHHQHLTEGVKCRTARISAGQPAARRKQHFHDQCMEIGMMIRRRRPAQDLLDLPHHVIAQPAGVIHQIIRQVTEQTDSCKKKIQIPFSVSFFLFRESSQKRDILHDRIPLGDRHAQYHKYRITAKKPPACSAQIMHDTQGLRLFQLPQHRGDGIKHGERQKDQELSLLR